MFFLTRILKILKGSKKIMDLIFKILSVPLGIVIAMMGIFILYMIVMFIVAMVGGFYDDITGGNDFFLWFLHNI